MKRRNNNRARVWTTASSIFVMALHVGCSSISPKPTAVPPPSDAVVFPQIVLAKPSIAPTPFTHVFTFESKRYEIKINIDGAALAGARAAEKVIKMTRVIPQAEQDAGLIWALISDPAQTGFFEALLAKLRAIKAKQALDTDRYAELIAVFVQSIEYCSSSDMPPKFPIETAGDGCGDCDDKSLLAAALLYREEYDVALFTFHREKHMALGIRSTDEGFMNSGYAYIETTSPSYIGFPSNEYSEVKISSLPDMVVLGEKPNLWTKSEEVKFLYNTLKRERARTESIGKELKESATENATLKAEYDRLTADLKKAKGRVSVSEYNNLVNQTNRMGDKRNRIVKKYNDLVQQHNRSNDIAAYIFDHPDDRYGVYRWVTTQK